MTNKKFTIFAVLISLIAVCGFMVYLCIAFQSMRDYRIEVRTYEFEVSNIIQGNSFIALSALYYPIPITHGTLIDCLIKRESAGNPRAIGKAGEKGILQFMPSTYQHFCVEKYGLPDDIWSVDLQRECAEMMLCDDLGHHWTTMKFCK